MNKGLFGWLLLGNVWGFSILVAQSQNVADDPAQGRYVATSILRSEIAGYEIQWGASPGWVYEVERVDELGGEWTVVERIDGVDGESVVKRSIEVNASAAGFFRVLSIPVITATPNQDIGKVQLRDYLPPQLPSAIELYNEFEANDSLVFYEHEAGLYHFEFRWAGTPSSKGFFRIGASGLAFEGWSERSLDTPDEFVDTSYMQPLPFIPAQFELGTIQESMASYVAKWFLNFETGAAIDAIWNDKISVQVMGVEAVSLLDEGVDAVRIDTTWDVEVLNPITRTPLTPLNESEEWTWRLIESWWLAEGRGLVKVRYTNFTPEGDEFSSYQYLAQRPNGEGDTSNGGEGEPNDVGEGNGDQTPSLAPELVAFTNLVVGKQLFDYGMLSETRFSWQGETGNWGYEKTGASTGELVFTYDEDGNDESVYREVVELRFEDSVTGTFSYSEWSFGTKTSSLEGSFSLSDLNEIPGFGNELPNDMEDATGVAPSSDVFRDLVVGRQLFDFAMISPTRFIWEGEGGEWSYQKTGPTTGRLILTYDEDGNNRSIYYEQVDLNFSSSFSGMFVYSEWSNQEKGNTLEGPFNLDGLPPLP